jgi:hypothetical protein
MYSAHSTRHFLLLILVIMMILAPFSTDFSHLAYGSSTSYPPYAKVGAHAFYSGNGGFIAFLSGVSGNVSYYVSNVYSNNNSMRIFVNENISLGTEAGTNTSIITRNLTDSIFAPITFPAVSPANLTSGEITFENTICRFVTNSYQTVPAGTFNATEFQGKSSNGTTFDFWFDRSTGLAIEMVQAGSYLQLVDSNVAVPVQTQSQFAAELPFILIFIVGWAGAGVLFYWVRRYYIKKSERENKTNEVIKTTKETNLRKKKNS